VIDDRIRDWLRARADAGGIAAVSGAQGSGKSHVADAFAADSGLNVARLSLDDVYLTKAKREALAGGVHPLFATRGAPGTHDLELWDATLAALHDATARARTPLPRFDKLADDRAPRADWPVFAGRRDLILLDGWCLGATPQPAEALADPVNDLEREEDADGVWRTMVNDALAGPYARRFDEIDAFLFLEAPAFEAVAGWRLQAEEAAHAAKGEPAPLDLAKSIARFVQHYERISRWMLAGGRRPGATARLDAGRTVTAFVANDPPMTE